MRHKTSWDIEHREHNGIEQISIAQQTIYNISSPKCKSCSGDGVYNYHMFRQTPCDEGMFLFLAKPLSLFGRNMVSCKHLQSIEQHKKKQNMVEITFGYIGYRSPYLSCCSHPNGHAELCQMAETTVRGKRQDKILQPTIK